MMNLYEDIYQFAEDKEIDYQGLLEIAKRHGKNFVNENEFCEFKNAVDSFLRSNQKSDLEKVEKLLS